MSHHRYWVLGVLLAFGCQAPEVETPSGRPPGLDSSPTRGNDAGAANDGGLAEHEVVLPTDNATWQAVKAGEPLPEDLFAAGQEGTNTFGVCRAPLQGGLHAGKLFPTGMCNVPLASKELNLPESEALIGGPYYWKAFVQPFAGAPREAVVAGYEATGETLYVCRAVYESGVHPGKLVVGQCNIAYGGKEVVVPTFDLLLIGARVTSADAGDPADADSVTDARDAAATGADAGADATGADATDGGRPGDSAGTTGTCTGSSNDLSNVGPGDFRISFHISTTQTGWVALLNQRAVCTYGAFWDIRQTSKGTIIVEADDVSPASYRSVESTTKINDGRPHDVLVTRIAGILSIRIDGALAGQGPLSTPLGLMPPLSVGTSVCSANTSVPTAPFSGMTLSGICIARGH